MILTDEQTWQSPLPVQTVTPQDAPNQSEAGTSESLAARPSRPKPNADLSELDIAVSVWNRFPKRLLENCKAGTPADPIDKRLMVATLADYVLNDLQDATRGSAARISKHITGKYPATFGDTINGVVVGTGSETLRAQLYNAMQYRKDMSKTKHRHVETENSDEDTEPSDICRKQDEYGCSDYQPLLAETESAQSQEKKRLELTELYASEETNRDKILELIESTYSTQRTVINAKKRDVSKFFIDRPCFGKSLYLIKHADRLLGKTTEEEWKAALNKNAKAVAGYFKSTYKSRERKRKADKPPTALETVAIEGLQILTDCKNALTAERSVIPMHCVVFPHLINHFKDTADKLYKVDTDSTELDQLAEVLGPYPVLIIQGKSYYDEDARYIVAVEKCFVQARSLSDGFLTVMLAYYVFGYAYESDICKTLEFIQRVLLGVNPKNGHKRAKNQRKSV